MIRQITVLSGKGGAGKTTITAALASLAVAPIIADCDVDASNMHLLLDPIIRCREDFWGLDEASIDSDRCIGCGKCRDACRYDAIGEDLMVGSGKCEGCAACTIVCPVEAVSMMPRRSGEAYVSDTRFGPMVHAHLYPGEEASGKLISHVRERAVETAEVEGRDLILIDGPPGSGCEVIASITGVDLVVLVVEPTVSGIHDSKRILELCEHFNIPVSACINKYDINPDKAEDMMVFLESRDVKIVGVIPYTDIVNKAMMNGVTIFEYGDPDLIEVIRKMWIDEMISTAGLR